ncbi:MAG: hypothetical protein AVDCRST_MAG91-1533, partial [uncultured Sphingomonadaceae bacterium]
EQHAREDHRPRRRRLDVRVGKPGVDGPHRHLDREAREEGEPQQDLRLRVEVEVHQGGDERRPRLPRHPQHRDQHHDRAEQRI